MKTREIKFRGWHTGANRMFSAEEMAADQLTLLPTGNFINVHGSNVMLSTIYPRDKFIPLQFTGRKDRNGKDMYESDIAKIHYFHDPTIKNVIGVIEWIDSGFAIRGRVNSSSIYSINFKTGGAFGDTPAVEVIGNIYQNPELLNETVEREHPEL